MIPASYHVSPVSGKILDGTSIPHWLDSCSMAHVLDYFPDTYDAGRAKFRALAKAAALTAGHAEIESFPIPSKTEGDLTLDTLYIPAATPQTLLLLTSGVHGAEGPTGSAIQAWFLAELWPKMDKSKVGLAMVHAFNPFGFRTGRRATENNVNLNRNFLLSRDDFKTPNEGYRKIAKTFESERPVSRSFLSVPMAGLKLATWLSFGGFRPQQLLQAIAQGQYEFPKGIEYGGRWLEPQTEFFYKRIPKWSSKYKEVLHFDLHTGIGKKRRLHLIPGDNPWSRDLRMFKTYLDPVAEKDLYEYTPGDSPGFYKTIGDINSAMPSLTKKPTLALTFEFGTLGDDLLSRVEAFERLWLENVGQNAGFADNGTRVEVRNRFREMFNPSEKAWRENAITLAAQVLTNVSSRL